MLFGGHDQPERLDSAKITEQLRGDRFSEHSHACTQALNYYYLKKHIIYKHLN